MGQLDSSCTGPALTRLASGGATYFPLGLASSMGAAESPKYMPCVLHVTTSSFSSAPSCSRTASSLASSHFQSTPLMPE
jgi:hypothetical protein